MSWFPATGGFGFAFGLHRIWPSVCACPLGKPQHSRGGCKAQLAFYLHLQWLVEVCMHCGKEKNAGVSPSPPPGGGGGGAASPFFFAFLPPSPSALVTIGISDVFLLSTFFFSFLLFIKRACMCVCAVSFP